ncbi:hypothetical protein DFP72DRAFT_843147 [Ephemerocybe angulata]|uniref:Uncharacterized protein n=1 Tax=Ephemerocybe angulata TaxID=980116 RepID=A0A8H6IAR2_9AGAR|nr:hypothetical protein DFP72DRAFT_843147 [Tulosesus angulatus]
MAMEYCLNPGIVFWPPRIEEEEANTKVIQVRCQLERLALTALRSPDDDTSSWRISRVYNYIMTRALVARPISHPTPLRPPLAGRRYVVSARSWPTVREISCTLRTQDHVRTPSSPEIDISSRVIVHCFIIQLPTTRIPRLFNMPAHRSREVVLSSLGKIRLEFFPDALPTALTTGRRYVASGHFQPFSKTRYFTIWRHPRTPYTQLARGNSHVNRIGEQRPVTLPSETVEPTQTVLPSLCFDAITIDGTHGTYDECQRLMPNGSGSAAGSTGTSGVLGVLTAML